MKRILVTGGAGFVAFYIAKKLVEEGNDVTIIDNFTRNKPDKDFQELILKANVSFINADMTDRSFINSLTGFYDEIYHLAAINGTKYFYSKPYEVLRVNILALMNLLEWVTPENTGKFLFTSSSEAYAGTISTFGKENNFVPTEESIPLSIDDIFNERFSYGGSKLIGELLTINYFKKIVVPFSIIRYHNIYGPRMGFEHVIPEFSKRIYMKEDPFTVFGGDETRAFCYIDDAVESSILVMRSEGSNKQVVHVGNSKEEITIIDLAQKMLNSSSSDAKIKIEKAPEGSVKRRCPNTNKLKKLTGFEANVSLEIGLKVTLDWYLNAYKEKENE